MNRSLRAGLFLLFNCILAGSIGLASGPACMGDGESSETLNGKLAPMLAATSAEYCYAQRSINGPAMADYYAVYCEDDQDINSEGVGGFAQDRAALLKALASSVIAAMSEGGFEKVGQFGCETETCDAAGIYIFRRAERAAADPATYAIVTRVDMGISGISYTISEDSSTQATSLESGGASALDRQLKEMGYTYEQALPSDHTTIIKTLYRHLP